jgi:hypothetical protein
VPERAKERGRACASAVDRKLASQRALVAARLREAQQEGALLPQRVCLLMEGQKTERGEPVRRRHHEEGSASGAAAMWKRDKLLGVGGWAEATAEMEPRKKAKRPRPEWHSGRARPAWHKAMQLYPDGQRPAVLRDS